MILIVLILFLLNPSDNIIIINKYSLITHRASLISHQYIPSRNFSLSRQRLVHNKYPIGYVGNRMKLTILHDSLNINIISFSPEYKLERPVMNENFDPRVDYQDGSYASSGNFGLPSEDLNLPLYFPPRRNDNWSKLLSDQLSTPQVILATPVWPDYIMESFSGSAVVEGYLTLHKTGRVTLKVIYEYPKDLGFAQEVLFAIANSKCYPAVDSIGHYIDMTIAYRCIFTRQKGTSVKVTQRKGSKIPYEHKVNAVLQR